MKHSGDKETSGTKKVILLVSTAMTLGTSMILLAIFYNPEKNLKVSDTAAQK